MTAERKKGVAEAGAAFVRDGAEARLKVRRVGNSLGVVLPRELLARLGVGEGDALAVSAVEDGVILRAADDEVARQVAMMQDFMVRYAHTMRELAK